MPVLLWTDCLVLILTVMIPLWAWSVRKQDDWRMASIYVCRSPAGMAAAIILVAFLAIALLDSLHHRVPGIAVDDRRTAASIRSVFDELIEPLRQHTEKTYSAPLATHAFAKELLEFGPIVKHGYPRLRYGGRHLRNPATDWRGDILLRLTKAATLALCLWSFLVLAVIGVRARMSGASMTGTGGRMLKGHTLIPYRSMLLIMLLLMLFVSSVYFLGVDYHLLGTDKVGQDVLYQTLKSIRTGILIGTLTTLVMLPLAVGLGVAAGYFGGCLDDVVQYVYTTLNSIPGVLLIAAAVLMVQVHMEAHGADYESLEVRADLRLLWLCIILGITSWTGLCRVLRAEALKLREAEYVLAAQAMGVSNMRILVRHIVPNVMPIVLISVALDFSGLVLAEAVLSYVNIGVDPTMNSWGNMINAARLELAREPVVWWSLSAAFVFMSILVLAANVFADVVRDAFDPRTRV